MKRYVMFTWVHPDDAAAWEAWSAERQEADVENHRAWFGRHADRVKGGSELSYPPVVKTLRPGRQGEGVVTIDGPYLETKEFLGGYVEIEAEDMDEAVAIATGWPSLASQPNATVQVREVMDRG